jgi:uncharacterized protein
MIERRAAARRGTWLPLAALLGLCLLMPAAFAGVARAQDSTAAGDLAVPQYTGYVNDFGGVYDDASKAKLESFLDQVQKKTGAQFAVLIMKSTAPESPTEYKTRVFDAWKIGQKGKDNGLLMLVALDEREVRFETGYGLEGVLPDGLQSRIFRDVMVPHFRQGDTAGGVTAGVLACSALIAKDQNVALEWDGSELRYDDGGDDGGPPSRSRMVSLIIAVVFVLILTSILRRRFGGYYGGFGGWGGGFGGFGGGFGGGGGGGSSFGGFGGGSSGGGGGGGRW